MNGRQQGFSLITAIFLLTVVAALVVFMVNLRGVQQTTLLYGVQGARALQAARSGIEWGIHRSIVDGSCVGSSTISHAAFAGFSIEVRCSSTTHFEGAVPINTYYLEYTANEYILHYKVEGTVPEPATMGFVVMGMAFLRGLRRRTELEYS